MDASSKVDRMMEMKMTVIWNENAIKDGKKIRTACLTGFAESLCESKVSVSSSGFGRRTLTTAQRMIQRKASCETENEQAGRIPSESEERNGKQILQR